MIPEFVALSEGNENDMIEGRKYNFPKVALFFKGINQNLKIKAFVGPFKNAVLAKTWIAMISYLLMSFAKHSVK